MPWACFVLATHVVSAEKIPVKNWRSNVLRLPSLPTRATRFAAATALLLAWPVRSAGQENSPLENVVAGATQAVVLIDVETPSDTRQGSGFIVDPVGLIVTNHHVVRDARSARVKLASGDVY